VSYFQQLQDQKLLIKKAKSDTLIAQERIESVVKDKLLLQSKISDLEILVQSMKEEKSQTATEMHVIVSSHAVVLHECQLLLENAESKALDAQATADILQVQKNECQQECQQSNIRYFEQKRKSSLLSSLLSNEDLKSNLKCLKKKKKNLRVKLSKARKNEDDLLQNLHSVEEENRSLIADKEAFANEHRSIVELLKSSRSKVDNKNNDLNLLLRKMREATKTGVRLLMDVKQNNLDLQQKLDDVMIHNDEVLKVHATAMNDVSLNSSTD